MRAVTKLLLIDGLEEHFQGALDDPILDGRHIHSTLPLNPNQPWDLSRLLTRITPCVGSSVKSSASAEELIRR